MKIKTISDNLWDSWYCKPLIFIGFHPLKKTAPTGDSSAIAALAVFDNGICECRNLEDSHRERERFFRYVVEKYRGAPVNIFNQKTQIMFDRLIAGEFVRDGLTFFYLKGNEKDTQRWKKELDCAISSKNGEISADNPIHFKLNW